MIQAKKITQSDRKKLDRKQSSRHVWRMRIRVLIILAAASFFGMQKMQVLAAKGTVTYGSESYNWHTGEVCPIGVYVNSDVRIGSYEVCLEYDTNMLRYLDGASEQVENRLYIRGTGVETTYKTMLHFEPLQAGDTSIRVVSAACTPAMDVSGNAPVDVSGNVISTIEMIQLSVAPVTVMQTVSNRLQGLAVEPVNIQGFAPNVFYYELTVEAEVENINVSYATEDDGAEVTISDTTLMTGENMITVSVKGTAAEESIYTLHVIRKEPVAESVIPTELPVPTESPAPAETPEPAKKPVPLETSEQTEAFEPAVSAENIKGQIFLQNPVLWLSVIAVAVLFVAYSVRILKNRKTRIIEEKEELADSSLHVINLEETVIDVQHVTMCFRLAQDEASSLKEYMIRTVKGQNCYNTLTALNDISFEVKQGDVVGIIGTNGSGKSTLLKIISGALNPTLGHVEVDRSKVQMLTLGTGFDMELTARENVYLNGAIIGYTREYIDERYEEIVEFAELQGFMEERMKNFSSGMVSRLGFAIATMRDTPDILILDEVLSVGDMFFRQKSEKRIKEMIHSGATVLIVSHSTDTILKNCNRAVWIEKGDFKMEGTPKAVCAAYMKGAGI
mgnify:CR=1 FL=1